MKITSKFKDYYDGALNLGVDDGLHWIRSTKEYNASWKYDEKLHKSVYVYDPLPTQAVKRIFNLSYLIEYDRKNNFEQFLVIVGSKWWRGVKVGFFNKDTRITSYKMIWNPEDLKKLKGLSSINFDWEGVNSDDLIQEMYKDECPLYLLSNTFNPKVIANPCLREHGIIGFTDVNQISQEIQMWFGNKVSKDDTPVKISDKDRIVQHGFDKWSFRKVGSSGMY